MVGMAFNIIERHQAEREAAQQERAGDQAFLKELTQFGVSIHQQRLTEVGSSSDQGRGPPPMLPAHHRHDRKRRDDHEQAQDEFDHDDRKRRDDRKRCDHR